MPFTDESHAVDSSIAPVDRPATPASAASATEDKTQHLYPAAPATSTTTTTTTTAAPLAPLAPTVSSQSIAPSSSGSMEKPPPAYSTHDASSQLSVFNTPNRLHRHQSMGSEADSARTLALTSTNDHPASCFYSHPETRYSAEVRRSESKPRLDLYSLDLEPGTRNTSSDRTLAAPAPCSVWPGTKSISKNRKLAIKPRGCNPLRGVDKRKRAWIKALIALIVIALAVGIGVGISRAVGGGVWKSDNSTRKIEPS